MPTQWKNKFKWYSAISGAIAINTHAQAQISYTDLDPDVTRINGEFPFNYLLNLDGAGTPTDFTFGVGGGSAILFSSNVILAAPFFLEDENGIMGITYTLDSWLPTALAYQLELGDTIGEDGNFFVHSEIATSYYYGQALIGISPSLDGQPNFWADDNIPHFVGLRFVKDGNLHYGWARLSVEPDYAGFTLYDYAWNTVPNAAITAGATDCAAPEILASGAFTTTSAKVKWSNIPSATQYELQVRALGTASWNTVVVDAPKSFRKLSGLNCATDYEWQVRAICDGMPSAYSAIDTFATLACRMSSGSEDISIVANGQNVIVTIEGHFDNGNIEIYNGLGQQVHSTPITTNTCTLHLNVASGIYFARVIIDGQLTTQQLALSE